MSSFLSLVAHFMYCIIMWLSSSGNYMNYRSFYLITLTFNGERKCSKAYK